VIGVWKFTPQRRTSVPSGAVILPFLNVTKLLPVGTGAGFSVPLFSSGSFGSSGFTTPLHTQTALPHISQTSASAAVQLVVDSTRTADKRILDKFFMFIAFAFFANLLKLCFQAEKLPTVFLSKFHEKI
jgi:hypothetical protein